MDPIEYQTFAEFLAVVQPLVAPEDLAEQIQALFREYVGAALSDVQTLIPWLRGFNATVFDKADVEEFCATSVFQGPQGKITQLFAYVPGRDCRKYYYKRVSSAAVDCWMENQRCVQCTFTPPPTNIYDTPYCNYVILGETACAAPYLTGTEDDCKFRTLDDDARMFSVGPDYKVYAAPRFPCGYSLFMQWQGIKRKWNDGDLVPVDQQIREAIIDRVEAKIAKKEKDWVSKANLESEYSIDLRTLRYRYHDEQDEELKRDCTGALERFLPAFSSAYVPVVP